MPKTLTRLDAESLIERMASDVSTDHTDDRILVEAARAVMAVGPSAVEVDDVAAAAGVGRSTIYRRYGDRNGLLVAALAHEGRRLLDVLADATSPIDDPVEEIVAAFGAGVRFARATDLAGLARRDPVLLHLLTVDSQPLLTAASEHLTTLALDRDPSLQPVAVRRSAEVLLRLALSFALAPASALDEGGDIDADAVRRHVGAVVLPQSPSSVVAAPTS